MRLFKSKEDFNQYANQKGENFNLGEKADWFGKATREKKGITPSEPMKLDGYVPKEKAFLEGKKKKWW